MLHYKILSFNVHPLFGDVPCWSLVHDSVVTFVHLLCQPLGTFKVELLWFYTNTIPVKPDTDQVGITGKTKSKPGSNSDIDKSNPGLVLQRMLSECLKPRFTQHL